MKFIPPVFVGKSCTVEDIHKRCCNNDKYSVDYYSNPLDLLTSR